MFTIWYTTYFFKENTFIAPEIIKKSSPPHNFSISPENKNAKITLFAYINQFLRTNLLSSEGSNCSMDLYNNIISLQLGSAIRTLGLYSLAICFMYLSNLMVKFCRSTNLENCGKLTWKKVLTNENTYFRSLVHFVILTAFPRNSGLFLSCIWFRSLKSDWSFWASWDRLQTT